MVQTAGWHMFKIPLNSNLWCFNLIALTEKKICRKNIFQQTSLLAFPLAFIIEHMYSDGLSIYMYWSCFLSNSTLSAASLTSASWGVVHTVVTRHCLCRLPSCCCPYKSSFAIFRPVVVLTSQLLPLWNILRLMRSDQNTSDPLIGII